MKPAWQTDLVFTPEELAEMGAVATMPASTQRRGLTVPEDEVPRPTEESVPAEPLRLRQSYGELGPRLDEFVDKAFEDLSRAELRHGEGRDTLLMPSGIKPPPIPAQVAKTTPQPQKATRPSLIQPAMREGSITQRMEAISEEWPDDTTQPIPAVAEMGATTLKISRAEVETEGNGAEASEEAEEEIADIDLLEEPDTRPKAPPLPGSEAAARPASLEDEQKERAGSGEAGPKTTLKEEIAELEMEEESSDEPIADLEMEEETSGEIAISEISAPPPLPSEAGRPAGAKEDAPASAPPPLPSDEPRPVTSPPPIPVPADQLARAFSSPIAQAAQSVEEPVTQAREDQAVAETSPSPEQLPADLARQEGKTAEVVSVPPPIPVAPEPAYPEAPEAAADTLSRAKKPKAPEKPWFDDFFDDDYLLTLPHETPETTMKEVAFIANALDLQADARILDVGCGYGRHASELSAQGYRLVGLDKSLPMLIRAAQYAEQRGVQVEFMHGDMREMKFEQEFDGIYCFTSTFGYFDDETNRSVLRSFCRALKPPGRFLLETVNRDFIISDLPLRVWWEGEGCLVMEEVEFNYFTSRIESKRSVVFNDGRQIDRTLSVRAYSLHELGKILHNEGFRVLEVTGDISTQKRFFGMYSPHLIIKAERRS